MKRLPSKPRDDYMRVVQEQGLSYAVDRAENGGVIPYWDETAQYELSEPEVDFLEAITEELHEMTVAACAHMLEDRDLAKRLGMPLAAADFLAESLRSQQTRSLYGRFDIAYFGEGKAKLLEYNADTPAALFEAAVTQWHWLEEVHPQNDQWNMLHERLVQAWTELAARHPGKPVHFAVGAEEPTEDWVTVAYLRDTAREAGMLEFGITMEEIGWNTASKRFVDGEDREIDICFKMYPWEWMLNEEFGLHLMFDDRSTTWLEPAWKALAGSKALLASLWELYPDHPYLLPTFLDGPHGMKEYVAKPMYGWEGAGIEIVCGGEHLVSDPKHTQGQQMVYQQFVELPVFDGNRPVLGTWVINGHAAGLGIRESTNLITDTNARFVPHYMNSPRSSDEQVQSWLATFAATTN